MKLIIVVVMMAISFTACKAELGGSDSESSSSSLLSMLADLEGYQYYKHENMCNEFPAVCATSGGNADGVLDKFNDPDASADEFGTEDGIDADGDNSLDAIGVDTNGDGTFDFVVADLDGDGVFDSVLVKDDGEEGISNDSSVTKEEEDEIMNEDGNGYPNAHSYESPDNQDGIEYGEKVWCGTNKLGDTTGDGIISWEDTQQLMDGNIGKKKCNDPDWFCHASITDRRCLDADVLACGIDPNGPTCGSQEAIDMYGPYEGGAK